MTKEKRKPGSVRKTVRRLIVIAAVIALLPSVLTVTGQQSIVLRFLSPTARQAIQYRSLQLHWWAPIVCEGLAVRDLSEQGQKSDRVLLSAERVQTDQPLWKIALGMTGRWKVSVQRPCLNLVVDETSSNLEQTLERISGDSADGDPVSGISLSISEGSVSVASAVDPVRSETSVTSVDRAELTPHSETPQPTEILAHMQGTVDFVRNVSVPIVNLAADIINSDIAAEGDVTVSEGQHPRIAARLDSLAADHVMLPFTEEQLQQAAADSRSSAIRITSERSSGDDGSDNDVTFTVDVHRVHLNRIRPLVRRFAPLSDLDGMVSCRVEILVAGANGVGLAGRGFIVGQNVVLRHADWAAGEWLDLGELSFRLAVAVADDGLLVRDLHLRTRVGTLVGDGQVELRAPDPVKVLRQSASGRTEASEEARAASAGQVRLKAELDLAQVGKMLPRTLHLDSSVTVRRAVVQVGLRLMADQPVSDIDSLIQRPDGYRWQLVLQTSDIDAQADGRSIVISSLLRADAEGTISPQASQVQYVRLSGVAADAVISPADGGYEFDGQIRPRELWEQLKGLVNIPPPQLSAPLNVRGHISIAANRVVLRDTSVSSTDLNVLAPYVSLPVTNFDLQAVDGRVSGRGRTAALQLLLAPWSELWFLDAESEFSALLDTSEDTHEIGVQFRVTAPEAVATGARLRPAPAGFHVSTGALDVRLKPAAAAETWTVQSCTLQLPGLDANAVGSVGSIAGAPFVDLKIQTAYDLAELSPWLLSGYDRELQFSGRRQDTLTAVGLLSGVVSESGDVAENDRKDQLQPLTIEGTVGWERASVYGINAGPATTEIRFRDNVLRTAPLQCDVEGGRLHTMLQWDVSSNQLRLASGSRVEKLQLTPEFCRNWLSYVAPLLSDSLEMTGTVSARVQECELNLDSPRLSRVDGYVDVHQLEASPGPSLDPLLGVLELIRKRPLNSRRLRFPQQRVSFRYEDGRMFHDRLEADIADYVVVSRGTVGPDEQIRIELGIPLERGALDRPGRSLTIPVTGRLGKPKIDIRGVAESVGRQQLNRVIDKQLNRGLNKLLEKLR